MLEFNKRHEQLQLWLNRIDETLATPLDTEAELAGQRAATERTNALANDFAIKTPQVAALTETVCVCVCVFLHFFFLCLGVVNFLCVLGGRVCA
jgi:hypothetical protein